MNDRDSAPTIAVVVPTYRRPDFLSACLQALDAQVRPADEVLAVIRPDDHESMAIAEEHADAVRIVPVHEPGLVAALTAGARATTADIVAFTDDDAEPRPEWTARLIEAFSAAEVGAVGGRDIVVGDTPLPDAVVGRVGRWGKVVGNHSRGTGGPREVDVLKGVNMAYRREALAMPVGYAGRSTQAHSEVAMGLWARRQGWKIVYDPSITVCHHEAPRNAATARERWRSDASRQAAFNLVAGMLAARPELFWRRAVYGLLVGDRGTPGVARAAWSLVQRRPHEARALWPSLAGQVAALRATRRGDEVHLEPIRSD